jgi:altronate hydrolase
MSDRQDISTFHGYRRADGRVGTRNYLGVVIVGNCAATAARQVAAHFNAKRLAAYSNIDGVVPFIHELGCGMEKSGEPMDLLRRTLGGSIRNPNLAGAVVMALGCERNNIYGFLEQEGLVCGPMLKSVVLQEAGGTRAAIEEGIAAIESMLDEADRTPRSAVPVSELVIGLQADRIGGERAVHQAIGHAVDKLVRGGGTAIVTDTAHNAPVLVERAASPNVSDELTQRISWWKTYTAGRDTARATASGTPSFSGSMPLEAVFGYAHPLPAKGLLLMDAPGHEAAASSGLIASGATLLSLASRDSFPSDSTAAPTVKLAMHAAHYARFHGDLDFDASPAGDGLVSIEDMGERIFARWIAHASGEPTRGEEFGPGEGQFVPWHIGVLA